MPYQRIVKLPEYLVEPVARQDRGLTAALSDDNGTRIKAPSAPDPTFYYDDGTSESSEQPHDCNAFCAGEDGEVEPPQEPAPAGAP